MKLLIAGGGTGGHLFPGIAVAEEFLTRDPRNEVLFVGTERGIEARVLPKAGYHLECIATTGMRGKSTFSKLKGIWLLLRGYAQSRSIIRSFKPDLVLGVGGYASGPLVLAARNSSCKCFIHEQNALPGLTNRILAKVVKKVFISLEESRRHVPAAKLLLTGNPLRKQILEKLQEGKKPNGNCNGNGKGFRLLVFGGSAGAHRINMAMIESLPELSALRERITITHQTGEQDLEEVRQAYLHENFCAEVVPFIDNMADAYQKADLILCRAGATTIAEVTACGKACIFVPYPYATDDHQRKNAEALVEKGAGFMILDRELSGKRLSAMIEELERNPLVRKSAGQKAAAMARPDAAKLIVDAMLAS
ncbi:MAG: undecaprenyldiphospho-muramoylpentapeptide beta-N-acetylglucosaminyltransferase [Deltaproteobacteria bacterium]|nr:undecaprenyldiphospho-muramoylpentapeptide beta-N-acetylglucosaminyltransferase [Deltaproteobacteria bacterium]TLN02646.1 MAG: undecaprenyldiphospho-muramoylpentapeptide beta-N-acetylglucosaminyltransferase [bacterium]